MDNISDKDKKWSTLIRQVFLDLGGEVQVGDKDFLVKVKTLATEKENDISFNLEL